MTQTHIKLVSEEDLQNIPWIHYDTSADGIVNITAFLAWFNSLASAPEVGEAVDMDENTAKRFRGILSLLGISAPESDESLMLCQFSLLGMMRHKIQQLYDQPSRTADAVAWYVRRFGELIIRFGAPSEPDKYTYGDLIKPLYTTPQPDRTAQLDEEKARLVEDLKKLQDGLGDLARYAEQIQTDKRRLVEALKKSRKELDGCVKDLYEEGLPVTKWTQQSLDESRAILAEMEGK